MIGTGLSDFRILDELGEGGMGVVCHATLYEAGGQSNARARASRN